MATYQSTHTGAEIDAAIGAVSGKAEKSEMSVVAGTGANADKTTITLKSGTSATVLTTHQDISGKADASDVTTLQGYFTNGVANSAATASTASALAASKTLWGQSFDGSANVSGNMTGVGTIDASGSITTNDNIYISNNKGIQIKDSGGAYQSTMYIASSNNLQIGNDTAAAGYATFINGNTITFRYSTSKTIGMVINTSGNVGIGITTPTAKLHVDGDAVITGSLSLGGQAVVSVFSGSSAPSSSTGSNGDIYIQTS